MRCYAGALTHLESFYFAQFPEAIHIRRLDPLSPNARVWARVKKPYGYIMQGLNVSRILVISWIRLMQSP